MFFFVAQMHPVLRQMRPQQQPPSQQQLQQQPQKALPAPVTTAAAAVSGAGQPAYDLDLEEGEGLARLGAPSPERHPRVQLKKDSREAYVPQQNLFRDRSGEEPEEMRASRFNAGRELRHGLDRRRVLQDEDFEVDEVTGISPARAHVAAANLVSAYEQTVKEERNFQKSFNNHVRTLIAREEVTLGLMHLWDLMEAITQNPTSKPLTAQLFLVVQHSRDNEAFREALLNITEPNGRWLYDLINILQSIIVQERSLGLAEKVAAINYSVLSLGKYYARKIYKTPYVPIDKEVKIDGFYMRMTLKVLTLSDDLGVYRNDRMHRAVSASRRRELSDRELMHSLQRALTGAGTDGENYFDMGADLQWQPSRRVMEAAGCELPYIEEVDEAEDEEGEYLED